MSDTILEVHHVARRLKCSPERVRQLIREGKLHAWRLTESGPWRIDEDALERFIAERKVAASSKKTEATDAQRDPAA